MRFALLADIHGNLEALRAVLGEIDRAAPDGVFCLGDVVGYGANPKECLAEIRRRNIEIIAGNHDFAVAGKTGLDYFNAEAQESVLWTRSKLDAGELGFLGSLPLVQRHEHFVGVHGTFTAPESFDYVLTPLDAHLSVGRVDKPWGFIAHSHIPVSFLFDKGEIRATGEETISIRPGTSVLVNVGSVGQPRDLDPRSAFALLNAESQTVEIRRVEYDVPTAARKIIAAGLPGMNAYRLYLGR